MKFKNVGFINLFKGSTRKGLSLPKAFLEKSYFSGHQKSPDFLVLLEGFYKSF
jgi:hypothetical protein